MDLSLRGLLEIVTHEAIVPMPYKDAKGVWTYGIGHTAEAGSPDPTKMPKGIEQPLVDVIEVFRRDILHYAADVRSALKVPVAQHEFDALVSFHFNTGAIRSALLTLLLNDGRRQEAAEAFDNWRKPPQVVPRREREKLLFRDGIYSGDGRAMVYTANSAGAIDWEAGRRVDIEDLLGLRVAEPAEAYRALDPVVTPPLPRPVVREPRRYWPLAVAMVVAAAAIAALAVFWL